MAKQRRTEQAADLLLNLADASLPGDKDGVLKLLDFRANQQPPAIKYVQKARELAPSSLRGEGLLAIGTAITSQQPSDWQNVLEIAERALSGNEAGGVAPSGARRPMVEYVAAFAASQIKDPNATQRNAKALGSFCGPPAARFQGRR